MLPDGILRLAGTRSTRPRGARSTASRVSVVGDQLVTDRAGDGHAHDARRLLADLQRVARLLVRALRPRRSDDRAGPVQPGASRRDRRDGALRARGARRGVVRAGRRRRPQRPLPRRLPHAGAHAPAAGLLRRRAASPSPRRSGTWPRSAAVTVGSFAATATEVYQEGLRLPPVRLVRRGEPVEDVWKIMLANHRTPRRLLGRPARDDRLARARRAAAAARCSTATARRSRSPSGTSCSRTASG